MNFGEILTRAWCLTWRYRVLWLFGLFASLGAGGSNAGGNGKTYNLNMLGEKSPDTWLPPLLQHLFHDSYLWGAALGIVAVVGLVGLVALNTFGRIGLVRGIWSADEGTPRLSFKELWLCGRRYFWRILLPVMVLWGLGIGLTAGLGFSSLIMQGFVICLMPVLCILYLALWAITILADLTIIASVNEDLSLADGLGRAWCVLTTRPLPIFIIASLLWFGTLVIGFVTYMPTLIISTPLIRGILNQHTINIGPDLLFPAILFLCYLPVFLLVQLLLQTYSGAVWTLVFRRVTHRQAAA